MFLDIVLSWLLRCFILNLLMALYAAPHSVFVWCGYFSSIVIAIILRCFFYFGADPKLAPFNYVWINIELMSHEDSLQILKHCRLSFLLLFCFHAQRDSVCLCSWGLKFPVIITGKTWSKCLYTTSYCYLSSWWSIPLTPLSTVNTQLVIKVIIQIVDSKVLFIWVYCVDHKGSLVY